MGTELLRPQDCLIRPAPFRKPNPNPRSKRRRQRSPKAQPVMGHVMGHVIILKRGEPLDAKNKKAARSEPAVSDLPMFEADPLRPSPALVPKQIRLAPYRVGDVYAGSAFATSPSPRKVPLPSFSRKEVDLLATKDLRRILQLD